MKLENYKTGLYQQPDGSWVADIRSIPAGCYPLMDTREAALAKLTRVIQMIAVEKSCAPSEQLEKSKNHRRGEKGELE